MKRLEENWEKITEVENKLREKVGDPDATFEKTFLIPDEHHEEMVTAITLPFHYRGKKKDGSFTKQSKETGIIIRYCPFTGKPLYG